MVGIGIVDMAWHGLNWSKLDWLKDHIVEGQREGRVYNPHDPTIHRSVSWAETTSHIHLSRIYKTLSNN